MRWWKLSVRLFARDWRAGELRLFAIAVSIAVGAVTAVGFFNDRVQQGISRGSADLLGADVVATSSEPIPRAWVDAVATHRLKSAVAAEFSSVVVHGERLQLASIRAVDPGYPLRGALRSAPDLSTRDARTSATPEAGTVWVEARLLYALNLRIGDRIEIGNASFVVKQVLTYEPGRGGNFFAMAPRLLMHRADVERTGVIQPGSRVAYALGVAGADTDVTAFQERLRPDLTPNQRVIEAGQGNLSLTRALSRIDRYLGLTSLLAVILAGVAIAMAARRYSARHYDMSALLRCFGAAQRDVLHIYLPQLALLGIVASVLGCVLGYVAQEGIYQITKSLFPTALPSPSMKPIAFGVAAGLITLAGFAVAPIMRLKQVSPLRVLRRDLVPLPASALAVYGSAAVAMVLLLWRITENWTLTAGVLVGAIGAAALLGGAAFILLRASQRLHRRVGVAWRFGLNNLWRRPRASVSQILAFGLALMTMAVIALVRTDLVASWQRQLPPDTPNYFAVNVLPENVDAVRHFFAERQVPAQAMYPMVRGRLTEINKIAVAQAVTKEQSDDGALQRDLNLTWAVDLPPDNVIVRGEWWRGSADGAVVSVEEKLAERLGIKLDDSLTFVIGGTELAVRVTSLRKVQWDSFHPNFFMMFPPGTLNTFPSTYITSFHLAPEQKPLLVSLVRAFPAITLIEIDQFLEQMRNILRQATLAVEFLLLFVLAAGFAVLYAALATSLDDRFYEGALLRTLGASRWRLRAGHLAEFVALGVAAGLLAAVGAEIIAYVLYARVFELPYDFKWPIWIAAPLVGAALVGAAGYLGTRKLVDQSPIAVLREI